MTFELGNHGIISDEIQKITMVYLSEKIFRTYKAIQAETRDICPQYLRLYFRNDGYIRYQ